MTVSRLALFLIVSSLTQGCGGTKNAACDGNEMAGCLRLGVMTELGKE